MLVDLGKTRIECVEQDDEGKYGKFVVEPLERGYGTTLGIVYDGCFCHHFQGLL